MLAPCDAPKLLPAIVTDVPTAPDVGLTLVILGGVVTAKVTPLLGAPFTVTTTGPVVAPAGTGATMLVALQVVGVAVVPLNLTVLAPCDAPKLLPAIVTDVPTAPDVGLTLVILGGVVTAKVTPLLGVPFTVTTTGPVVAPAGTGATMLVALQVVGAAAIPLNWTVLAPCDAPKLLPAIVTDVPTTPDVGLTLVMLGGGGGDVTVKATPLLGASFTVTTTGPVVAPAGTGATMLEALHIVDDAAVPLNQTVLAPCDAPKLLPAIVTDVPTTPDVGVTLVMLGAGVPPLAGRKAAMAAAQMSELFSVPFADTGPAAARIRSSAASFVFGAAGTRS